MLTHQQPERESWPRHGSQPTKRYGFRYVLQPTLREPHRTFTDFSYASSANTLLRPRVRSKCQSFLAVRECRTRLRLVDTFPLLDSQLTPRLVVTLICVSPVAACLPYQCSRLPQLSTPTLKKLPKDRTWNLRCLQAVRIVLLRKPTLCQLS